VRVLTVNAGSSSLKLRVLDEDDSLVIECDVPAPAGEDGTAAVAGALDGIEGMEAVGHRVVHGGGGVPGPGAH